ncbi:hypothetical protein ACFE04_016917 [Oxalis oulophora]
MDDLPPSLLVEILSRLTVSDDLARSRLISKSFNDLSYEVKSINLLCTLSRYLNSRSPQTINDTTPFKSIFSNLVSKSLNLESISIGVEKSLAGISYDDVEDESDDLFLSDGDFFKDWGYRVSDKLKRLSISDFWIQSCWRRSDILTLISSCCYNLLELELKNAWLSVDGLNHMHSLTNLTLEFIRLDDENLDKINECFPHLESLNLVGVGGLKEPKIHLLHLKTCQWTVSNAPLSLTVIAPNLVRLKLKCVKPNLLFLDVPLLSDFDLSIDKISGYRAQEFPNLINLHLMSWNLWSLIGAFRPCNSVKKLRVDSDKWLEAFVMTGLETLFDGFPNISSLSLGPGAWSEAETWFSMAGLEKRNEMKKLKELILRLPVQNSDATLSFICSILRKCSNVSDVSLLIHREAESSLASRLIFMCTTEYPGIIWKIGMWKEGTEDTWFCDGI